MSGRPFLDQHERKMIMTTTHSDRLMTLVELSEMLGVPAGTLYAWRHRGEGPPGYRLGRHVRYRRSLVEAWLSTRTDDARSGV